MKFPEYVSVGPRVSVQRSGAIGAGLGAIEGMEPDEKPAAQIPLTRQAVKPWQEIYREKYGRL